jgi:glycosyltransferase involved in cell wall biosynthesis
LTFVGKLDTIPNTAAVRYIAEEIYPAVLAEYPQTVFLIIGQNYDHLLPYKKERMIFTGFVSSREDVSPNLADYLSASDVVIVPLDSGSGTRVKILEAAACSRAIVSTEIGAEGLDFVEGREILLSERVDEEFIGLVLGLLKDKPRRQELGRRAREKVLSHYSWEREVAKFERIYQEMDRLDKYGVKG